MKTKVGDKVYVWCTEVDENDLITKRFMREGIVTAIGSNNILYSHNGNEETTDKGNVFLEAFPEES